MRVVLIYPTDRNFPGNPYPSLPMLTACLRRAGHEVFQHDVNLEVFEALTSGGHLLPLYDELQERMQRLGEQPALTPEEAEEYAALVRRLAIPRDNLERADEARRNLQNPDVFYDPDCFNRAYDDLRGTMRFYSGDHPLDNAVDPNVLNRLFHLLKQPLTDPVTEAVQGGILDRILAHKPDLVGISIPFMVSYWEALKIAKQIKTRVPGLPIVIGGALTENHERIFAGEPRLFDLYDYVIVGDGDRAVTELAHVVEHGGDLSVVPNLHYRNAEGNVTFTFEESIRDLNGLPSPDYAGLPLDRYPTPHAAATFQTSRGCYYGKCTFCSESFRENYRLRKPELVVQDMETIYDKTGIRHFYFWDSLCPPRTLRYVAQQVKERNLPFTWFAETKMEKTYLPPEFMQDLHAGGCRFLQFGFESASQRVLDLIDKDNYLPEVDRILTNMHEAGVMACMSWFIGFPTETEPEARLTYDYLRQLGPRLSLCVYAGVYHLLPDQPLFNMQDKMGIDVFQNEHGGYIYTYKDGSLPYDRYELHQAYEARTDNKLLHHGGYLLYAESCPDKLVQLTGPHRAGPLARHVADLRQVKVRRSDATVLQMFPRDIAQDFSQPARPFKMAYHQISGQTFRLRGRETTALEVAANTMDAESLRQRLGVEWPEMEDILTKLTNRGLLRFVDQEEVIEIEEATAHYAKSDYLLERPTANV